MSEDAGERAELLAQSSAERAWMARVIYEDLRRRCHPEWRSFEELTSDVTDETTRALNAGIGVLQEELHARRLDRERRLEEMERGQ